MWPTRQLHYPKNLVATLHGYRGLLFDRRIRLHRMGKIRNPENRYSLFKSWHIRVARDVEAGMDPNSLHCNVIAIWTLQIKRNMIIANINGVR